MKRHLLAVCAALMTIIPAEAEGQFQHLTQLHASTGDSVFVALYGLPESRPIVIKHIVNDPGSDGFEVGFWRAREEAEKAALLEKIGVEFDRLERAGRREPLKRVADWQRISSQLKLMEDFLGQHEGFLDLAYADPVLRPAFQWILDQRSPAFDPKNIGGTFSAAQVGPFHAELVKTLLDTPHQPRMECFSRLFARIARSAPATEEAAPGGTGTGGGSK